jgi:hypothetical protein
VRIAVGRSRIPLEKGQEPLVAKVIKRVPSEPE